MKLAIGAAVLFVIAMASPASAQNQRYCFQRSYFGGGGLECTFLNMRQCLESASGRGGVCVQNPRWVPQPAKRRYRR
jgi:hypothetical protein